MTSETIGWLNENRNRSYPMARDEWRGRVPAGSAIDCVLLDALVFDGSADPSDDCTLLLESVSVGAIETIVTLRYCGVALSVSLSGGGVDGEGSFEAKRGCFTVGGRAVSFSLAMSSHAYILSSVGEGSWSFGLPVLRARVVRLSYGSGVSGISVNGSSGVPGMGSPAVASGDVVLEDGYRTSPTVRNGSVLVRVGRRYGLDPCGYDYGPEGARDCRSPLFFFCGQNAINSGNIILKGGRGIVVSPGGTYRVRTGSCAGRDVPCIEITAGTEVMSLYRAAVSGSRS